MYGIQLVSETSDIHMVVWILDFWYSDAIWKTDHSAIEHMHDLNTEHIHYSEPTTIIFETNIRYVRFKLAFLMSENWLKPLKEEVN